MRRVNVIVIIIFLLKLPIPFIFYLITSENIIHVYMHCKTMPKERTIIVIAVAMYGIELCFPPCFNFLGGSH
jgi:hypothetical protein